MNKENSSKLWKMIQEAGDYLLGEFYLASSHKAKVNGNGELVAALAKSQLSKNFPLQQINKYFFGTLQIS